jgi:ABC-2 type transport system permease protein
MRLIRLLGIFYRNSLATEMEYRANFVVNLFMTAFWVVFAILGLKVFFFHRERIGDWDYFQSLLVVGFYTLFNGVIESVLQPNITRIVTQIRQGTFDFVLVKPLNSQFLASLRHLAVWKLIDILVGTGICVYTLWRMHYTPDFMHVLLALIFVANAAVIVYSIWLILVSSAFWFVRVDNITELFNSFFETGRFPVSAYPPWLRGVLTFVVPIAFVTTFPAAALLGRTGFYLFCVSCAMAVVLFMASVLVWRFAVRHYSSASS